MRTLTALGVGFLWPLAVTFAYFAFHHSAALMLQSWLWPLHHYTKANHVPYGYQNWSDYTRAAIFQKGPIGLRVVKIMMVLPGLLVPVLPLVAAGLWIYWIVRLRDQSRAFPEAWYYTLVCSVLSGLLISVIVGRADILHFMYLTPLWYLVLAWILEGRVFSSLSVNGLRVPLIAFVGTSFGLLSMAVLFAAIGMNKRIETRRGLVLTGSKETVIDYVQARLAPGSELLVYPYLPLYNYLTNTHSPAPYDYFQPGMNTHEQAEQIMTSLRSSSAPVLFESGFSEKIANSWPGTSIAAIVDDPVGDYIARNYRICKVLASAEGWQFQFMAKKGVPCPDPR